MFFGSNARSSMADAAKGSREANCPWCFELSCFYTVGRSLIWVCDYCKGLCEPDEGNTALIRRDPLKSNNEKSGFHLPKVFKSFQTKKHAMFARSHSRAQTLEDLTRPSPQREQAAAAGVLRPFMILVSMPVVTRAQLAITLGFSLITEPIFGKPHEEAWEILNRPQVRLHAPLFTLSFAYDAHHPFRLGSCTCGRHLSTACFFLRPTATGTQFSTKQHLRSLVAPIRFLTSLPLFNCHPLQLLPCPEKPTVLH